MPDFKVISDVTEVTNSTFLGTPLDYHHKVKDVKVVSVQTRFLGGGISEYVHKLYVDGVIVCGSPDIDWILEQYINEVETI